ncbi:MAG: phospholipase D-like domain-containing protein [Myxococcota bacterium]
MTDASQRPPDATSLTDSDGQPLTVPDIIGHSDAADGDKEEGTDSDSEMPKDTLASTDALVRDADALAGDAHHDSSAPEDSSSAVDALSEADSQDNPDTALPDIDTVGDLDGGLPSDTAEADTTTPTDAVGPIDDVPLDADAEAPTDISNPVDGISAVGDTGSLPGLDASPTDDTDSVEGTDDTDSVEGTLPLDSVITDVDDAQQEVEEPGPDSETPPCEPPFACPWEGTCTEPTAYLTVHGLDVWAQEVGDMAVGLSAGKAGWEITSQTTSITTPLCGPATLAIEAAAPWHAAMGATVTYAGGGLDPEEAFYVEVSSGEGSAVLMHEVEEVDGAMLPSYSLWLGLAHHYFAASGPPARHGNLVTLLRDGEEAWATVRADLLASEALITSATWWWTSELELLRDPELHPYLTPEARWENTALGTLSALGLEGVESKILINQFYSQDGLLSWITADDAVYTAALTPSDGVEMLGVANTVAGTFDVTPGGAAFTDHLLAAWTVAASTTLLGSVESEPRLSPQTVDLNALPAGLGAFDIPLASWHQKFLTMDQEVAYIGGMNVKTTDWDTHQHGVYEPRRMTFEASLEDRLAVKDKLAVSDFNPRKDYMIRVEGPSAADAVNVFKERWDLQLASDAENAEFSSAFTAAPTPLPFAGGVQAQVVTTMPEPFNQTSIADTLLRAISQADEYIYIEDQYFRSPILADAIVDRMLVDNDVVLIVVTGPVDEWVDPGCWQTHLQHELLQGLFADRYGLFQLQSFDTVDTDCTFCIDEVEATFQPMSMHSKLVIIDDLYLEVGSCNHNNRGLLYEGEAAVAVFDNAWVSSSRGLIFQNLLDDYYEADVAGAGWLTLFQNAALWNDLVYADWDDESFDLDLDGEPVPEFWKPVGFLYSLHPGPPSDCFFEDVGEDVTLAPTRG